jgi:hypothetical protein
MFGIMPWQVILILLVAVPPFALGFGFGVLVEYIVLRYIVEYAAMEYGKR